MNRSNYPKLTTSNSRITSDPDSAYNCFAWALGIDTRVFGPHVDLDYWWPPDVAGGMDIDSFTRAYEAEGFEVCEGPELEPDFDRIALYATPDGTATHATRQCPNDKWTSKLGQREDIEHDDPYSLEGVKSGAVLTFMRRRRR